MSTKLFSLILVTLMVAFQVPAQDLVLSGPLSITSDTIFTSVTVTPTGILTADGRITVATNMSILSGGIVTHSGRLLNGLRLSVTGTLDVQSGGLIDLNGKGLRGGNNGSVFGRDGEVYDQTGSIVGGGGAVNQGAGASYGGQGANGLGGGSGTSNLPYGLLEDPLRLGSGGGGTSSASIFHAGGNGGGLTTITAGTCIINGTLRANGGAGTTGGGPSSGAGSGGGIRLDVGTLSGSGQIQAIGGNGGGSALGGSGGGGRIAIYYNALAFPTTNISARGGSGGNNASTGTVYLKDNVQTYGDLVLDNGNVTSSAHTPLRTGLTTFRSLLLANGGSLNPVSTDIPSFSIEQPVVLQNASALRLSTGVTMAVTNTVGFDLDVRSGSTLGLDSASTLNANALRVNSGILNTGTNLSFPVPADLELSGGGVINILNSSTFSMGFFDSTNIKSGTVNLSAGGHLNVAAGELTIGSGVTLIKDGQFGNSEVMTTVTILAGALITHSARSVSGLRLNVTGTLDVQSGGLIDLNGKGLRGGNNGSVFGRDGEVYDQTGSIVGGGGAVNQGAGASYGGQGANGLGGGSGTSNLPYGLLEDPLRLGSGGGGTSSASIFHAGGNGGGLTTITAGTCIINGTLRANGGAGTTGGGPSSGAGSGGGIRLDVGTLSGSGQIQAIGGNGGGSALGGSGGGGRIAIYYNALAFPTTNISARGGSGGNNASTGTVYLKDNVQTYGDLVLDNGNVTSSAHTPLRTTLTSFRNVFLLNGGQLHFDTQFSVISSLFISNGGGIGRP